MGREENGRCSRLRVPLTLVHVSPPSVETNTPPCSPLPSAVPASINAYTRLLSAPDTETLDLPNNTSCGRPAESFCQVAPPSLLRKIPPSVLPESIVHGVRRAVHMDAKRTSGFFGSIERSSAPVFSLTFSTCVQVLPPSFVM